MTDPAITLASAFLVGLLGSVHCVGMCGGIVHALSFAMPTPPRPRARNGFVLLLYNLGRISSYAVAGALVGGLGLLLQGPQGILGPGLRVFAGLMMIAMGLHLAGWWRGLGQLEKFGNRLLWRHVQPLTRSLLPVHHPWQALLLGALWGWLPCGLVYSALTLAGASADWQQAALVMASFGLGTAPAMLCTGAFAAQLKTWMQKSSVRHLAALLVIAFGVWTLASPLLHRTHSNAHTIHAETHGR